MSSDRNAHIRQGMRDSLTVVIGAAPFGLLFGALAVDNGMSVSEAVLMSVTIYAGASQMVGLDLFGTHTAPWLIVLSIFAVNFRHILYSATIGPKIAGFTFVQKTLAFFFLVDPQFAEAERRSEQGKTISFAWYMGMALPFYFSWICETAIGALFGNLIEDPHALGMDFLLPIYFLALVMGFRRRRNWFPVVIASGVASITAYYTIGSPWHVSVGALFGIAVATIIAGDGQQPMTETEVEGGENV
tara:strand:+ start:12736 stop:13470 length:735 start_codon:yes stop_codon:yes gene_type:complete